MEMVGNSSAILITSAATMPSGGRGIQTHTKPSCVLGYGL